MFWQVSRKVLYMALLVAIIFLMAAVDGHWWQHTPKEEAAVVTRRPDSPAVAIANPREKYPVYPHSLVPGGVHSIAELRAVLHDTAISDQFPDFDLSEARLVRLKTDRLAYVSFRKDGKIYWTKKPVLLRAGELIITDGHYSIRAQCGNGISFVPMAPTEDVNLAGLEIPDPPVGPTPPGFTSTLYPTAPPMPPVEPIQIWPGPPPVGPPSPPMTGPPCIGCTSIPITGGCSDCNSTTPPPVQVPDIGDDAIYMGLLFLAGIAYWRRKTLRPNAA